MKIEIIESAENNWFDINITPETMEEQNKLLRLAANAKRNTVEINTSFSEKPNCGIFIRTKKNRVTSIDNKKTSEQ